MEPQRKITKTEDLELKEMIYSMQDIFFSKLKSIEEKIDKISTKYVLLEKKVDNVISTIQGFPDVTGECVNSPINDSASENNSTMCVDEYPDGSWLGDPNDPDFRLRCPITLKDLEHINNTSASAQKMSLTLLDFLFPREVQACSNLSGTGKHGKKQLDPYMIEGIKYHVAHMFRITEKDWNHIKLNIDSKCRTAFRRKLKGMPINVKGERGSPLYECKKKDEVLDQVDLTGFHDNLNSETKIIDKQMPTSDEENSLTHELPVEIGHVAFPILSNTEVIHTELGSIEVIRATKEQFEMLEQNPNIEVLQQSLLPS